MAMTDMTRGDARAKVAADAAAARPPRDGRCAGRRGYLQVAGAGDRQVDEAAPGGAARGDDQDPGAGRAAGASLDDLRIIAAVAEQKWRASRPDADDDGFDDRYMQAGTTFGGAGIIRGNLTPECAAAVQAVLEALGKKAGPEDPRTEGQRFHDALQAGCELLIRAKMVPDRAARTPMWRCTSRSRSCGSAPARGGRRGVAARHGRRAGLPDRQGRRGGRLRRGRRTGSHRARRHAGGRQHHRPRAGRGRHHPRRRRPGRRRR